VEEVLTGEHGVLAGWLAAGCGGRGDRQTFGRSWSDLMHAANGPSFAQGIRGKARRIPVLNAIFHALARRLADDPRPAASSNVLLSIEKT
jgi:hypothetical protein